MIKYVSNLRIVSKLDTFYHISSNVLISHIDLTPIIFLSYISVEAAAEAEAPAEA